VGKWISFTLRAVEASEKQQLDGLLQAYLAELATFSDDLAAIDGRFEYPYLDHYWREPDRFAFFILDDQLICGFSLVRALRDPETNDDGMELAEIYVLPEVRQRGAATEIVRELFRRWPGAWQIGVLPRNEPAYRFWQRLLQEVDSGLVEMRPGRGASDHILFRLTAG